MPIPIYDLGDLPNLVTFNNLNINNPADPSDDTIQLLGANIVPQLNTATDAHPNDDGSEVSPVYRSMYILRLDGIVRGKTLPSLLDKCKALALAFDPALASTVTSPSTAGVLAMDFKSFTATADSAYTVVKRASTVAESGTILGYSVPSRYYVRSRAGVLTPSSAFTGLARPWSAELLMPDPRRYLQTLTTVSATPFTDAGDYPTWPTFTITMAGAGSATYTMTFNGHALVLNLSGLSNNDVVVVTPENHTITLNGVAAPTKYVSGDWTLFRVLPGSNTQTQSNTTNATTVITYRRAFCV